MKYGMGIMGIGIIPAGMGIGMEPIGMPAGIIHGGTIIGGAVGAGGGVE